MALELSEERMLGNYRLMRLLGRGGYASVYLGKHIYLGSPAAVKMLDGWYLRDEQVRQFQIEARMLARLRHRHIVRVLDFGLDHATPYLAMEYAPHGTLRQYFPEGTSFPLATILPFIMQAASALQYIHNNNVMHCDVKPGNFLLGPGHEVWLSDFGIARASQKTQSQQGQNSSGTPSYSAPEQIMGRPEPASDQYALGVMVYELLCGQLPFEGSGLNICSQHVYDAPPPLRELNPVISAAVEDVVLAALAKDPRQRFETVMDFALSLQQAGAAETQTAARSSGLRSLLQRIIHYADAPALQEREGSPAYLAGPLYR